jgi:hypothetical protein
MDRLKKLRDRRVYFGLGLVIVAALVGALALAQPTRADCTVTARGKWTGTCGGAYADCEVMVCKPSI